MYVKPLLLQTPIFISFSYNPNIAAFPSKPLRFCFQKKLGPDEATPNMRRRGIGAEKMEPQGGVASAGRARTPFSVVTNRSDLNTTSDVTEAVDFTKEEVETLLNEKKEKKKGNTYDNNKVCFVMFLI